MLCPKIFLHLKKLHDFTDNELKSSMLVFKRLMRIFNLMRQ